METVNLIVGALYIMVGLGLTMTLVSRLYVYWQGFEKAQKCLLIGVMMIMWAFTTRGVQLLWFEGPDVTLAAYPALAGALVAFYALILPVDKRLEPESWKEQMRVQDPQEYDKYIDLLNKSAEVRMEQTKHSEQYRTSYDE